MKYLPIRICSPQKNRAITTGYLHEIYICPMLQAFFKKMRQLNIPYALFSRKLGICLEGPRNERYNDHEELSDSILLEKISAQYPQFKKFTFLYWNHRPLTHSKWVQLLIKAGFDVIELRTLAEYESYFPKSNLLGWIRCSW